MVSEAIDLTSVADRYEQSWIENFVEVPHPALGGWPPCPYARKARLDRDYDGTGRRPALLLDLTAMWPRAGLGR
jgi:hypothetical protein